METEEGDEGDDDDGMKTGVTATGRNIWNERLGLKHSNATDLDSRIIIIKRADPTK